MLAGGVVAVIKRNLTLPSTTNIPTPELISPVPSGTPTQIPTTNIVDTLNELGAFRYSVAAIKLSNLNSALSDGGNYTIFAPTDDAVAKLFNNQPSLPRTTAEINKIVGYHVVSGKTTSTDLLKSPILKTLEGQSLTIKISSMSATVNNAQIIDVDIPASNGVIHVIDSVLIPPK